MFKPSEKQIKAVSVMNSMCGKSFDEDSFFESKESFQEYFTKLQKNVEFAKKKKEGKIKPKIRTKEKLVFLGEKLTEKYGFIYTEKVIKDKFKRRTKDEEMIYEALCILKEKGIINDERFVKDFITKKIYLGKGLNWIKNKLKEKGYFGDIQDIYYSLDIENIQNENFVRIFHTIKDRFDLSNQKQRDKFINRLKSKGYSLQQIKEELDGLHIEIVWEKKEISETRKQIIISKYKRKYNNYKKDNSEKQKFINALKLQGFSWSEIKNELL